MKGEGMEEVLRKSFTGKKARKGKGGSQKKKGKRGGKKSICSWKSYWLQTVTVQAKWKGKKLQKEKKEEVKMGWTVDRSRRERGKEEHTSHRTMHRPRFPEDMKITEDLSNFEEFRGEIQY